MALNALFTGESVAQATIDKAYADIVQTVADSKVTATDLQTVATANAAVQTDLAPPGALLEQLFWNRSITTELLLGANAPPTDAFRTARLRVARDGTLLVHGRPIGVQTTFFPAQQASLSLNGQKAEGDPWRMDRGGRHSTTACLAWCETWFRPRT